MYFQEHVVGSWPDEALEFPGLEKLPEVMLSGTPLYLDKLEFHPFHISYHVLLKGS